MSALNEYGLTPREMSLILLLEEGYRTDRVGRGEMAEELDLSESTVREYLGRLCERYDCAPRDLPLRVRASENSETT